MVWKFLSKWLASLCLSGLIFGAAFLPCRAQQREGRIILVRAGASGAADGTSWEDAFPDLQRALAAAQAGDEIWVATGLYRPGSDREASFYLHAGVKLYGGFRGDERDRDERNWSAYPTILSGDLNGDDNGNLSADEPTRRDNAYHVVTADVRSRGAVLDGFVIQGGNARGEIRSSDKYGGGLHSSQENALRVAHCTFTHNAARFGGAVYNFGGAPVFINCRFLSNLADANGGGMRNHAGTPLLIDCLFEDNHALSDGGGGLCNYMSDARLVGCILRRNSATRGGAIRNYVSDMRAVNTAFLGNRAEGGGGVYSHGGSAPTLTNCVFVGNVALFEGGGMHNHISHPVLTHCTFSENSAYLGSGLYHMGSTPVVTNCIFWAEKGGAAQIEGASSDPLVTHTLVKGGYPGALILSSDPLFRRNPHPGQDGVWGTDDDDYGDLRLEAGSLACDAGDVSALPGDIEDVDGDGDVEEPIPLDLAGNPRLVGLTVDLGAFERPIPVTVFAHLPIVLRGGRELR
ncbi:MAG: right-handed parallel beta-helix repeat-containing protein [Chloroflexi bacterium]|nr:right-handed parallel beta-helix repeat-containing protein [Chloroflexota bacterium]